MNKIPVTVGEKWRSMFGDKVAVVKEIRGDRVMVVVDGNREWLSFIELQASYKQARKA